MFLTNPGGIFLSRSGESAWTRTAWVSALPLPKQHTAVCKKCFMEKYLDTTIKVQGRSEIYAEI